MAEPRTTEQILRSVFSGEIGADAARILGAMGHLYLDESQLITDAGQLREQNLVKTYLRQAGFEVTIVQRPEAEKPPQENLIDTMLKGRR